jgi:hypothetical protein
LRVNAIRSRPGGAPTSSSEPAGFGGGAAYGAPASSPWVASSIAAESRTLRVMTCSIAQPCQASP